MEEMKNTENGEFSAVITKDMIVGDILKQFPTAAYPLMNCGMGCIHCGAALMESLEDACTVHGMDADEVTKYLNVELGLMSLED